MQRGGLRGSFLLPGCRRACAAEHGSGAALPLFAESAPAEPAPEAAPAEAAAEPAPEAAPEATEEAPAPEAEAAPPANPEGVLRHAWLPACAAVLKCCLGGGTGGWGVEGGRGGAGPLAWLQHAMGDRH